jgi:hypothetical protein
VARCSQRVKNAVEQVGRKYKSFMRYEATVSFRGLFWYPPRGFDSWHTDGTLAQGWRLYLIDSDPRAPNGSSYLAFRDPVSGEYRRAVDSSEGSHVNMFEVRAGAPLWHAVASEEGHRLSVGIAISDVMAATLLQRLRSGRKYMDKRVGG